MKATSFDVIIIGAGSVGVPTAMYLAQNKLRILVIDGAGSVGQGSNKAAIGGIRATHSNKAKVLLSMDSINEFSNWRAKHGDDIEWVQGGYSFVAYDEETKRTLQQVVKEQTPLKTGIQWLSRDELLEKVPSLSPNNLLGGTYAPNDGSASPLKSINAFYQQAKTHGVEFHFKEHVTEILREKNTIIGVKTNRDTYYCNILINAAGAKAKEIGKMTGEDIPVRPNVHEAGVTEPVHRFIEPMIVDTRVIGQSSNFYFYQHATGQIIFCLTPSPEIWEKELIETSYFLPLSARRLLDLVPALRHVKVRRTWSGYYPMTPDGSPLIGWSSETKGLLLAVGMCGQGFMLGPGIGQLTARLATEELLETDHQVLAELSPSRNFDTNEALA